MFNRTIPLRSVDAIDAAQTGVNPFDNITINNPMSNSQKFFPLNENTSRPQEKVKEELKISFTKDKNLLNDYYQMRQQAYRDELGFPDFNGMENDFDRHSKLIVATRGGKVIGGMRLTFSDEYDHLPNEIPGTEFNFKNLIKKYDPRDNLIFSEISALVVAKHERNSQIAEAMFDYLLKESKKHGCHYVFGVASALVCRSDRKTIKRLGYDVEIVMSFPWKRRELYNYIRAFPMYTKLQ